MENQKQFRLPTQEEINALIELNYDLLGVDRNSPDEMADVKSWISEAYIAVFDRYATSCVGYRGKVMVVVWAAGPSVYEAYTWADGKLVREWQTPSVAVPFMPRKVSGGDGN